MADAQTKTSGLRCRAKQKLQSLTWRDWLQTLLPCCKWLRLYNWRSSLLVSAWQGCRVISWLMNFQQATTTVQAS